MSRVGLRTYLGLAVLFSIEALIFYTQLAEQVSPNYPRGYDQLSYFVATYRILNHYFTEGWIAFLRNLVGGSAPTGASFPIQAAFLALLGGANRTAMVSLNLIYFILLQATVFWTVLIKTQRLAMAWIGVAMLISLSSLFMVTGGIYDFRIDFSVMCLYGIWICAVLRTEAFVDLRWSVIAGFVGALLISMRYFTIAYLGTVTLALFAGFVVLALRGGTAAARQARNAFICGAIMLLIAAPLLFAARKALYAYYGVGHFLGNEKYIRAAEAGVSSLSSQLLYYPTNILWIQLGTTFLLLAAGLLLVAFVQRPSKPTQPYQFRFDLVVLGLAVLFPLVILNLDISKSPVVGDVVIIPVVLFCATVAAASQGSWLSAGALAAVALTIGAGAFVSHATAEQHVLNPQELSTVNRLNASAAQYILDQRLSNPHLAFDRVDEFLNTESILLKVFEHADLHRPIDINPVRNLGDIFAVPRAQALAAVEKSDILVITDQFDERSTPYPFNDSMRAYWPDLDRYAKANLIVLDSGQILGVPYRLYARPAVKVSGDGGGWITSSGITMQIDPRQARRFPHIVLEGAANYAWLGGQPKPQATAGTNQELPVTFRREGATYHITIDLSSLPLADDTIKLTFDRFFVPKKIGLNEDTRELVVAAPDFVRMSH